MKLPSKIIAESEKLESASPTPESEQAAAESSPVQADKPGSNGVKQENEQFKAMVMK